MSPVPPPRVLVIDDRFGRTLPDRRNDDRVALCSQFLLADVTGDEAPTRPGPHVLQPLAEAVFHRGQVPTSSVVGDVVHNDADSVLKAIDAGWTDLAFGQPRWSLVLLDLCFLTGLVTPASHARNPGMPEGSAGDRDPDQYFGLKLLRLMRDRFPDLPVVILSAEDRDAVSEAFAAYGARAFLPRVGRNSAALFAEYLDRYGLIQDSSGGIVGRSVPLLRVLQEARRASKTDWPVLIRGELGTGKELFARFVHDSSRRRGGPFLPVTLPAIPRELVDDALFGHTRGAYTGAADSRQGKFFAATGGTIFLDEIGDTPTEIQIKLFRVLETGSVERIGVDTPLQVDARVVSATNQDVEGQAARWQFRPELLDRLRVGGTLYLPPLRERLEDIPLLAERFVRLAEEETPGAMRRTIHLDAMQRLKSYPWPGNIRELRNCLFAAVREYPDVEYLVPLHLSPQEPAVSVAVPRSVPSIPDASSLTPDQVLALLDGVHFDEHDESAWAGKLPRIVDAVARLLLRQLRAALLATRGPRTRRTPQGRVQLHPAVRLLIGDDSISATQAADAVKRILKGVSPAVITEVEADPLLTEAVRKARGLRERKMTRPKDADE